MRRDTRKAFFKPRAVLGGVAVVALLALTGCKKVSMDDVTGSISGVPNHPASSSPDDLRVYSEQLRRSYEAHPDNKQIAMAYAKALRSRDLNSQAAAVMESIAIRYPRDRAVLAAFGKALADDGQLQRAQNVLNNADSPDDPNWSVLSTRGSIADQLGDHKAAQDYYETALKIAPGEPSVLSNLGLSYALSRDLPRAESAMRQAADSPRADMRERQNLALVLALEGKFSEAESVSTRDLPPQQAKENVAAIRQMISQSNAWRDIQTSTVGKAETQTSAASRKMQQLSLDASAR